MKYIIISLYAARPGAPLFWRGIGQGFSFLPFDAYQFTEEQLQGFEEFVNQSTEAVAVPLTEAALFQLGFTCSMDPEGWKSFLKKPVKS